MMEVWGLFTLMGLRIILYMKEVNHYVVEDMEYRLMLRLGSHRMVECRAEKHQKDAYYKDRHAHRGEGWICEVVQICPNRREG